MTKKVKVIQVQPQINGITVPKKIWNCVDCKTLTDAGEMMFHHVGHVGMTCTPILELFTKSKVPDTSGPQIIWVNKTEVRPVSPK